MRLGRRSVLAMAGAAAAAPRGTGWARAIGKITLGMLHTLSPADAMVDTVFIRRRDAHVSSALGAFLAMMRPAEALPVAAE